MTAVTFSTPAQPSSSYRSYFTDSVSRVAAAVKRPFQNLYLIAQVFLLDRDEVGIFPALRQVFNTARSIRYIERYFPELMNFSNKGVVIQSVREVSKEDVTDVLEKALSVGTPLDYRNSGLCIKKLIEIFKEIPEVERPVVIADAQSFFVDSMNNTDKLYIIESIVPIRADDKENVFAYARPLLDGNHEFRGAGFHIASVIDVITLIPSEDRKNVIEHAQPLFTERTVGWVKAMIIATIARIPSEDRQNVIEHAQLLFTETERNRADILREVALVSEINRAVYVQERLAGVHADNRVAAQHGVNVHEGKRDKDSEAALKKLWKHQGDVSKTQIDQAVQQFKTYVETSLEGYLSRKEAVLHALCGEPSKEDFGPLIKNKPFMLVEDLISGEELIGRLWIFASKIEDQKEQANAKVGMIAALEKSYETGFDGKKVRVCDPGKVQRLIVSVLQGRLSGVNVDIPKITIKDVMTMFFENEVHQKINHRTELVAAANKFCDENPGIESIKDAFLREIEQYANLQLDSERSE